MKTSCRFDLELYEDGCELPRDGFCDACRKYAPYVAECPKTFVDLGRKGTGSYFMCNTCCDVDFSSYPGECLTNDCEIAYEKFCNSSNKKSIFNDFLNELDIKNYSIEGNVFKFRIGEHKSLIISLDNSYEIDESLSLSQEGIGLFDASCYGEYYKAFNFKRKRFGIIEEDYVKFLKDMGFFVNECDILYRSDIKTPIIRFTSPMDIKGYSRSLLIEKESLDFVEIYPYNVQSIFQKEYQIPYFHGFDWPPHVFKSLEKVVEKNIHYKLIAALRIIQNRDKLTINQKIEVLHNLSTYFDFAFTELFNKEFSKQKSNANGSLGYLIEIGKIKSNVHTKKKLNELRRELTRYDNVSEF